jgi:hypothetical protein
MNFDEWLGLGYKEGWVGPPICDTHDGTPMSDAEIAEFDEGSDPCVHVLRLYESPEQKAQVECDHSPSTWRAMNRGLSDGTA